MNKLFASIPLAFIAMGIAVLPQFLVLFTWILLLVFSISVFVYDVNPLKKLPVFLCAFLVLVSLSLVNDYGIRIQENGYWYIKSFDDYIKFFPKSIDSSFYCGGTIEGIIILIFALLSVGIIRINIKTKSDCECLMNINTILGGFVALIALALIFYDYKIGTVGFGAKLFGKIALESSRPIGTFLSQNIASMYFIIQLVISLGLFLSTIIRILKNKKTKYSYIILLLQGFSSIVFVIVLLYCIQIKSIVAILILGVYIVFELFYFMIKRFSILQASSILLSIVLLMISMIVLTVYYSDNKFKKEVLQKIEYKLEKKSIDCKYNIFSDRMYIWAIANDVFKDNKIWGCGLNCFGFVWMNYRNKYEKEHNTKLSNTICYSAHNDILQLLAETGLVGFIIVLSGVLYNIIFVIKSINSLDVINRFLIVCCVIILLISIVDMPFRSPNILALFLVVWEILLIRIKDKISCY